MFRALNRTGRYLNRYPQCIVLHPNKWFKTQDVIYTKMLILCRPGHSVKVPSQQLPLLQPSNFSLFFPPYFLLALSQALIISFFFCTLLAFPAFLVFDLLFWFCMLSVLPLFQDKPSSLFSNTALQLLFVKMLFH